MLRTQGDQATNGWFDWAQNVIAFGYKQKLYTEKISLQTQDAWHGVKITLGAVQRIDFYGNAKFRY